MRMTNKIMQNNSLYNINNNKILQDKLSTMMSTQKKITRPSDDPVIAIRALRLRTSVSELTQYYKRNVPDAESWLEVTEKALGNVTDILTDMSKQANKAANKDLKPQDLEVMLGQIKSLRDEFYSTGNMDYAGRYIFTGYRTDTPLSFTEDVEDQPDGYPEYVITEQDTIKSFDTINYTYSTSTDPLNGMNKNNYSTHNATENDIKNGDIHRLRLSYDNLDSAAGVTIQDSNGTILATATTVSLTANPDPYRQVLEGDGTQVIYIPETGEILFGDKAFEDLEGNVNNDTEIQVKYTKDQWKKGDLRPEHYFACTGATMDKGGNRVEINYNQEYLTGDAKKQVIEYDVGYNQKIQVNTTADEVLGHSLDRDVDDLERALSDLMEISNIRDELDKVLKDMPEGNENSDDYIEAKKKYDVINKAYNYMRENVHTMFEHAIGTMQGYLDDTNVAVTDNGTRSQRLALIEDRLMDQETTFETLMSENEDIDIAEVLVKLTSAELTYNSALMATGKIMQTSLMNYI